LSDESSHEVQSFIQTGARAASTVGQQLAADRPDRRAHVKSREIVVAIQETDVEGPRDEGFLAELLI
jgi:hypothetical protein